MLECMSRTNVDIDDELLGMAMRRFQLRTKRETVNLALRQLLGNPMTKEEALAMQGSGYETDLDELRSDTPDWIVKD